MPRPRTGRRDGFTLLEMLAVVAVVAILLVLAATRVAGLTRPADLGASCRRVAAALRHASSLARERGQAAAVRIDVDTGSCEVSLPAARSPLLPSRHPAAEVSRIDLPAGVRFVAAPGATPADDGTLLIPVPPTGLLPAAAVHLEGPGGARRTVFVHPFTHAVRIEEGFRGPLDLLPIVQEADTEAGP